MTFASLPGAVLAERGDAETSTDSSSVVLHYGSFLSEQRKLAGGGVVARGDLAVFELGGSDRLRWLDSLSSQSLAHLQPGESAETLILDPQGHVEFVLHVVETGEAAFVVLSTATAPAAFDWLNRMRFRLDVHIVDRSDDLLVVSQIGSIACNLAAHRWVSWVDPWPGVTIGGFAYGSHAADWHETQWLVPVAHERELIDELESNAVPVAGLLAWHALRVEAGRPDAADLDDRSLPHEFDWLRSAVHLSKGCYRGQETVAKVHNLGRPPRRLVQLHLDGSDSVMPKPGDEVWASKDGEPRVVGHVTSVAHHYELGPTALALIKRAVPADLALTVHTDESVIAATQHILVPTEAGPAVTIPRMPRMGFRP